VIPRKRRPIDDAIDFLRERLKDGPVPSAMVVADAKAAGISEGTLERARYELRVEARKSKWTGGWCLELPFAGAFEHWLPELKLTTRSLFGETRAEHLERHFEEVHWRRALTTQRWLMRRRTRTPEVRALLKKADGVVRQAWEAEQAARVAASGGEAS
jgi:hypothetical protein